MAGASCLNGALVFKAEQTFESSPQSPSGERRRDELRQLAAGRGVETRRCQTAGNALQQEQSQRGHSAEEMNFRRKKCGKMLHKMSLPPVTF